MVTMGRTSRWVSGWLVAVTVGCGGEIASPVDPEIDQHPSIPEDAELAEGADVPLLPPVVDEVDADIAEDASVEEDVALVMVDVPVVIDAPARVDGRVVVDVPVRADVVAPRDVPTPPPRCTGSASGQSNIWTCTTGERSRQRCVSGRVETDACPNGCLRRPSGTNDVCDSSPPPPATTLPGCARRALLHWGLHPDASDRLRCAGVPAERITQTIGNAAASAGTHAADGTANGLAYSAATDISTRGLSTADIHALLDRLANQGFAAWYRWPGHDGWPSSEAPHIHAIYVGCRMKASLRSQVTSWLAGRNGLVSNTVYGFHSWTAAQRALVRAVYDRFN